MNNRGQKRLYSIRKVACLSTLVATALLTACAQQPLPQPEPVFEPVPELKYQTLSRFECHPPTSLEPTQRGDHRLFTANNVSFTPYDRLYIKPTAWRWSTPAYSTSRVSKQQRRQLHSIVEQAISSEWRQRFAWIPSDSSSDSTLALQVWITDFDPAQAELSHSVTISAELSDSSSGSTLLLTCQSKLPLTAKPIADQQRTLEQDSQLSQRLKEALTLWASAIGSHIAAQP